MSNIAQVSLTGAGENDPVSNVLKWSLLIIAIISFAFIAWGTFETYALAPPLPQKFLSTTGQVLMTDTDIVAGKAGFQRADLMDYGSIYEMGSYFGEDYTAKYLVRLAKILEDEIAIQKFSALFQTLSVGNRYEVQLEMQRSLRQLDLTRQDLIVPTTLAKAIQQLQLEISHYLLNHDFAAGWTKAYSLNPETALQTSNFLIYSSLTTVANRPGKNFSYTNNWPYEPNVGNVLTNQTFYWTWISFCFVFFGFGVVLYIYHRYLSEPDIGVKTPFLLEFKPLTFSQIKVGKYFIIVALVLLAQILVGALMAITMRKEMDFMALKLVHFCHLIF